MNRKEIIDRCRALRKKQTPAEYFLWQSVRGRKINGLKFLRQHPIIYENNNGNYFFFIADFYCAEQKLVIELDGNSHINREEYDQNRDEIINGLGIKVARFKNNEVDKVIDFIKTSCDTSPLSIL